jgi:hypothetical protein
MAYEDVTVELIDNDVIVELEELKMAEPWRQKKDSLEPGPRFQFQRRGIDEDVSGESIKATMYRRGDRTTGGIVFSDRVCSNVTGDTNAADLEWQSGDTDEAGYFEIEITIDYGAGREEVAPNTFDVHIYE